MASTLAAWGDGARGLAGQQAHRRKQELALRRSRPTGRRRAEGRARAPGGLGHTHDGGASALTAVRLASKAHGSQRGRTRDHPSEQCLPSVPRQARAAPADGQGGSAQARQRAASGSGRSKPRPDTGAGASGSLRTECCSSALGLTQQTRTNPPPDRPAAPPCRWETTGEHPCSLPWRKSRGARPARLRGCCCTACCLVAAEPRGRGNTRKCWHRRRSKGGSGIPAHGTPPGNAGRWAGALALARA